MNYSIDGFPIVGGFVEVQKLIRGKNLRKPDEEAVGFIVHYGNARLKTILECARDMIFKPKRISFVLRYPDAVDLIRAIDEIYPEAIKKALEKNN